MGKLEELRLLVADAFEKATIKADIDRLARIQSSIDEVSEEQNQLMESNASLIKDYKNLVMHTSFNTGEKPADQTGTSAPVSFDDALKNFMSNNK